jgi:hypothetical protein
LLPKKEYNNYTYYKWVGRANWLYYGRPWFWKPSQATACHMLGEASWRVLICWSKVLFGEWATAQI